MFLVLSTVMSQSVCYNKKGYETAVLMNDWWFEIIYPAKSKKRCDDRTFSALRIYCYLSRSIYW